MSFQEFLKGDLTESRADSSAKAIESTLKKSGIQFEVSRKIGSVIFELDQGYKIVTDGNVLDLKKGKKVLDTFPNDRGMTDRVVTAYEKAAGIY